MSDHWSLFAEAPMSALPFQSCVPVRGWHWFRRDGQARRFL